MKKNIIIIGCVLAVVLLIGFKLAGNKKAINEQNKVIDRSAIKVPVTTAKVQEALVEGKFALPAVLKAQTEANVTISASGKVQHLNFDLGTQVSKGQVIGSIDNSLKQLSLESTQLLLDKYKTDYERIKELYEGKAATEVDYNNAKYNYENTKTQVAQLKQQIADGNLIAPLSGIITKKNIEEGEYINPGTAAATIVDISRLKASVMVSERDVYKLKEGMRVKIYSDIFPDKSFAGAVHFISPQGDDSHNYEVEVTVENTSKLLLKGGTFVRVEFDIKSEATALQIPKLALAEGIKNPYTYTISGDSTVIRKLVLGRDLGENIEVLSGISAGDEVITSGQINLTASSKVEVVNK